MEISRVISGVLAKAKKGGVVVRRDGGFAQFGPDELPDLLTRACKQANRLGSSQVFHCEDVDDPAELAACLAGVDLRAAVDSASSADADDSLDLDFYFKNLVHEDDNEKFDSVMRGCVYSYEPEGSYQEVEHASITFLRFLLFDLEQAVGKLYPEEFAEHVASTAVAFKSGLCERELKIFDGETNAQVYETAMRHYDWSFRFFNRWVRNELLPCQRFVQELSDTNFGFLTTNDFNFMLVLQSRSFH